MAKYNIYAQVVGYVFVGEYEYDTDNEKEALDMFLTNEALDDVSLREIDDPEIKEFVACKEE